MGARSLHRPQGVLGHVTTHFSFMIPTDGQSAALAMIERISDSRNSEIGVVRGYAGTGKTKLLEWVGQELGDIGIVTPTGKAALRVREATGIKATTVHMWMYAPEEDEKGHVKFHRKKLEKIRRPTSGVMFIDEGSMVDEPLWDEFYGTCKAMDLNVVVIGDPFQLPPVNTSEDGKPFSLLSQDFPFHEAVELTEVQRQALDSPIIRASMEIRNNKVEEALGKIPFVVPSKLMAEGVRVVDAGGALICWTNAMRHKLNRQLRAQKKLHESEIMTGEPLLVLKNDYSLNVYNGEIVTFKHWTDEPRSVVCYDKIKKAEFPIRVGRAKIYSENIELQPEYEKFNRDTGGSEIISREYCGLAVEEVFGITDNVAGKATEDGKPCFGITPSGILSGNRIRGVKSPHLHANFGYALTCHKAQGSEWNEVITVVSPRMNLYSLDSRRWIYTALTRAKERVSICYSNE